MSAQDTVFSEKTQRIFDQKSAACVMGILNITPDSFHDGGRYTDERSWLARTEEMISQGADIIDIGAYSSRPGATHISEQEEEQRLIPAVSSIKKHFPQLLISADTFRASLAEKAVDAGAGLINDIGGGTLDKNMFSTVAKLKVPYILMHIQGTPQNMQKEPHYADVVKEVYEYFESRIAQLKSLGQNQIILDPGFGFGKNLDHNFSLLARLEKFNDLGYPLLAGVSRKSMINKTLGISSSDALNGTSTLNTIALMKGARILRVHDVKEASEVVKLTQKVLSSQRL
jgi:dihydropteroate synthase